ncbi:MAG: DUF4065 domain-containing protein [Candidatus Lokiarchaeota archaeon]|nr:DUF4065 domain-containing protein [Candidatus Lokiarchaeota archaeon]
MNITEHKILAGIKYFVKNTKNVGRTKLFKLLYHWDFIHFKKYGLSITGYDYYTFPFGPVPLKLYQQIESDNLPDLLKNDIKIVEDFNEEEDNQYKRFKVILKNKKIDLDWLSPNEIKILEEVSFVFKDATAKQMTEITHLPNTPYDKTKNEKGMRHIIDYFLAIDEESELDLEIIKERFNTQKDLLSDADI